MTGKVFLYNLANGKSDIVQLLLDILRELHIDCCVIGGLAVNDYADPVASLDMYLVITIDNVDKLLKHCGNIFKINKFAHSINLQHNDSDLRIQLQTDSQYQSFIANASEKKVLGYEMKVASLEDVLRGKIRAYSDEERRKSKRQKELADIMRLVETHPHIYNLLPGNIRTIL